MPKMRECGRLNKEEYINEIENRLTQLDHNSYTVREVNYFCFELLCNDYIITQTVINVVGRNTFMHCIVKNGELIARFEYPDA